jgi:2-iminoacetate synthase
MNSIASIKPVVENPTKTGHYLPKINTDGLTSFIPEGDIWEMLDQTARPDRIQIRDVIQKSLDKQRLDPQEMAILINADDDESIEQIYAGARELKERIYGNRIVLFAPLYVGNSCVNNCKYCGFRVSNTEVVRKTLTEDELTKEVLALEKKGHKRLIMVYGEHPSYTPEFIAQTVRQVYATKTGKGEIRRVNINAAPLDHEGYRTVKAAGIGTYQIFQESYHQETYANVHPSGLKSNYLWRLYGLTRAMEAGIDDVGIGALLGLTDWRFEVMSLLYHTIHLEDRFNVGPHTISFPRIEPALATGFAENPPERVSDRDFKRLIAILRLAVPYTGLILTCREPVEVRNEAISFGVSQIDAGSSIGIGSYSRGAEERDKSQFVLGDQRSLDQTIRELCEADYLPSFCTGCYRVGRTGEHFMEFAVPGFVKRYCTPNAVLTFLEYLEDYASPETRVAGLKRIQDELEAMPEGTMKTTVQERIELVKQGERDLFF